MSGPARAGWYDELAYRHCTPVDDPKWWGCQTYIHLRTYEGYSRKDAQKRCFWICAQGKKGAAYLTCEKGCRKGEGSETGD